jgi:hypothetical protein
MARKGSLSFVEQHLEKGLLGLGVLALLGAAVYFMVLEPNRVDFGGTKLGPRDLDEAVRRKAGELEQARRNAQPPTVEVPAYSKQLREKFEGGLFTVEDGNAPALPETLKVAGRFGAPLPSFEGEQEASNVTVVTPLRPASLTVGTGLSLARREQIALGATGAKPSEPEEPPAELAWVTVAAYYPLEAQQKEMTAAGYATYRAKVHVVGVDVQRQEMLSSGEFSEWADVRPGKAIPRLELAAPVYDSHTGELQNTKELDSQLELVQRSQTDLMQPPFFPVEAGSEWEMPPLPGHVADEDEETPEDKAAAKKEPDKKKDQGEGPLPGRGRGQAQPPPGGERGGERGGEPKGEPSRRPAQPAPSKAHKTALTEAKKALREKDYDTAEQKARTVASSNDASPAEKTQARKILDDAERARAKAQKKRTGGERAPVGQARERELITNPEKEGEVAVWFHDDSVQPGKTYRYRMRVKLWNRYVGRRGVLREPALADQTVIAGDWSLPSAAVTVAARRHFFVRSPVFGEPAANVEVFAWHKGYWLKEDFKVRVGDTIGAPLTVKTPETDADGKTKKEQVDFSTGAVVLDLRADEPVQLRREAGRSGEFAYREAKSLVIVYLDPVDGQVRERLAELDKTDPQYKKLKDEWESVKSGL